MIIINYLNSREVSPKLKNKLNEVFSRTIENLKQTENFEINFAYASEDEIQRVNKKERGKDSVTDVLSFPAFDLKPYEKIDLSDLKYNFNINPENESFMLGDILICKEVAKIQAKNLGHTFEEEIIRLALHSLLHCFGFDHIEDKDFEVMHKEEIKTLKGCGYNFE